MNKINTIYGSKLLSDKTMELYPYALKFYGNEYKSIIPEKLYIALMNYKVRIENDRNYISNRDQIT